MQPEVILFDEVTATRLIPRWSERSSAVIRAIAAEGMTCVLVTDEMGFAREAANRIYFTDRGVIVETGPPETFFSNPQDERTKGVSVKDIFDSQIEPLAPAEGNSSLRLRERRSITAPAIYATQRFGSSRKSGARRCSYDDCASHCRQAAKRLARATPFWCLEHFPIAWNRRLCIRQYRLQQPRMPWSKPGKDRS